MSLLVSLLLWWLTMSKLNVWKEPSSDKRNTDKAGRVTFIVYPDSAFDGWIDYLRDLNLKLNNEHHLQTTNTDDQECPE